MSLSPIWKSWEFRLHPWVFFFRGSSGGILFFNWPVFLLGEETNKKSREKQNKRPIFSNTPISFKPNTFQNTVCFFYLKKCVFQENDTKFPKLWTLLPSRPRWIEVYGECPVLVVCEWKPCTEFGFTTPYGCLHGGCNAGRTDFPKSLR